MTDDEKQILINAMITTAGNTQAVIAAVSALLAVSKPTPELEKALEIAFEQHKVILLNAPWLEGHSQSFDATRKLLEMHLGVDYKG